MKTLNFILLGLSLLPQIAISAEADNFSATNLKINEVGVEVNQLANNYLKKAVDDLGSGCDEKVLYEELRKYFGNHSKGQLVKDILYSEKISKNALPLKQSVYEEWGVFDGYLLGRKKAASSPLALSPLVQIGEQVVGVDKFEHMFGMGFFYFKKFYQDKKDIESILKNGIVKEKTFLGGNVLATGVFSYADLSANFNGMRFWNHILLKDNDILGEEKNLGPYVICQENKWHVNPKASIDFSNYIDASMDESINCSKFATHKGALKFTNAIKKRGFNGCPVDSNKLRDIQEKYRVHNIEHFIINNEGTGKVSYFNEF